MSVAEPTLGELVRKRRSAHVECVELFRKMLAWVNGHTRHLRSPISGDRRSQRSRVQAILPATRNRAPYRPLERGAPDGRFPPFEFTPKGREAFLLNFLPPACWLRETA